MKETYVQRNYKDTLFRMLFKEKENLLSLYNALNGTAYTDTEELEITTLENAVYMNYKNDVSFVFGYGKTLVRLPVPRFVVFYNGIDFQPEKQELRLSDAFEEKQEEPELELKVTVYNINEGNNRELMEACHLLKEYAQYVELVRKYAKEQPFPEAVERAVNECIKNGVLKEFLSKNRAEAIEMCIFEFDEEKYIASEREDAYKNGFEEGREEGRRLLRLQKFLIDTGRVNELIRVIDDQAYREQLYQELSV